jgi:hypothetical protein
VLVETTRGRIEVSESRYWHVVPTVGLWASLFFNNVRVGRGELFSVSVLSQAGEDTANASSGYGGKTREDAKEQEFERVRRERFHGKPSRINAIFVFDELHFAETASVRWFSAEPRIILDARVADGSLTHRGDATWLDRAELGDWEECALAYWNGDLTDDPFIEVVVHGRVFFPRWEEFPRSEEVGAGSLHEVVRKLGGTQSDEVPT